jgi:hypothetical protein
MKTFQQFKQHQQQISTDCVQIDERLYNEIIVMALEEAAEVAVSKAIELRKQHMDKTDSLDKLSLSAQALGAMEVNFAILDHFNNLKEIPK